MTSPAAYPSATTAGGVTQDPTEQAQQVIDRIHQLTDNTTIVTGGPLLAVLPYTASVPPTIPDTASPQDRKAACDAYIMDPLAYVPNPYQLTAPLHGNIYGFIRFISNVPAANYDGFRIDSPLKLQGVQEIFFTIEGDTVDPANRGPLFLTSTRTQGGIDIVHFELAQPDGGAATGTAALEVDLDNDPVQF